MILDEKLNLIVELATKDESEFCMRIAADLTVRARGLYGLDGGDSVPFYKALNELMHFLIFQSLNAMHNSKRYDLKYFITMIVKTADKSGLGSVMEGALDVFVARAQSTP